MPHTLPNAAPANAPDPLLQDPLLPLIITPPGRYRHYKGNLYDVIGTVRHSETLEPMTLYRALYGEGGLWVRPATMFNETVDVAGANGVVTQPRFAKMPARGGLNNKKSLKP